MSYGDILLMIVGQAASVYIKALIPEKMKVKLIIVDVFENSVFPSKINYFITSGRLTKWVYSTNEFGASSIKIPYGSMERTIPPTVSPVENNAAFSSHVPKSSL